MTRQGTGDSTGLASSYSSNSRGNVHACLALAVVQCDCTDTVVHDLYLDTLDPATGLKTYLGTGCCQGSCAQGVTAA